MKTNTSLAQAAVLALALAYSGSAGAQAHPDSVGAKFFNKLLYGGPRWAPVDTFDVAGVRLGMTPEEARAALRTAGFVPPATDPTQDSWSSTLSRRRAERLGGKVDESRVAMFTRAASPQGEQVEVWYAATAEGARASSVEYRMPTGRMERTAFVSATSAKYGRPTTQDPVRNLYCTKGEGSCVTHSNKALPHLQTEIDYSAYVVTLREGGAYDADLKARMAAAVEAVAPRNAKASF